MEFETAKKFIDLILDNNEATAQYIDAEHSDSVIIEFIGGEPFLEIDLVSEITDYFIAEMIRRNHHWATRFRISICSNGVLYFDPKVQEYLNRHKNHLSFLPSISLFMNSKKLLFICFFSFFF